MAEYGVQIKDTNGDLKSTYDILVELAPHWEKMSKAEQVALGTTLAGTNQYKVLSAVLSQMDVAQEAYTQALDSSGTTMKQNEVYMQSLEAKTQALKAEFEKLVIGDGGLQNFAKIIVELGTKILSFANSDLGKLVIALTAVNVAVALVSKNMAVFTSLGIIKFVKDLTFAFEALAVGAGSFGEVLGFLNINPIMLQLTILVGAIYGIKKACDALFPSYDKLIDRLEESNNACQETSNEIDSLTESLKNLNEEIDKLSSKDNLSQSDKKRLTDLRIESEELSKQIALLKEKQRIQREENQKNFKEVYNKKVVNPYQTETVNVTPQGATAGARGVYSGAQPTTVEQKQETTSTQVIKDATQAMNEYAKTIETLHKKKQEYNEKRDASIFTEADQTALDNAIAGYKEASSTALTYAEELQPLIENVDKSSDEYIEAKGAIDGLATAYEDKTQAVKEELGDLEDDIDYTDDFTEQTEEATKTLEDMTKELGITEKQLRSYADALSTSVEGAYEYLSLAKEIDSQMNDFSSAYSNLESAISEYNSTGELSFDTLNKLLTMNPEYIDCLTVENGQLKLNEEALNQTSDAMLANVDALLAQQAEAEIAQIVNKYYSDSLDGLGTSAVDTGTKVEEAGLKAKQSGLDAKEGGEGWVEFWDSISRDTVVRSNDMQKEIDAVRDKYKILRENAHKSTNTIKNGAKSSASANSKLSSSVDLVTKAIEKQISALKKEKEVALDAINAQINALKKEKEARVKAIEKEIKALEKQKKEREKYWEDQLKKLEKENDERERGIELQEKQQALAQAQQQQVMLFKDGQFQYSQDEDAVAGAQQDLQETEDKLTYERQKELIEELRDTELEWYEERIEQLEEYKEQVEEYYDEQIEQLEEYKEYLEEYYDQQIEALEETKERVSEVFASMSEELQAHYATMLADASNFVEAFNDIISQMGGGEGVSLGGSQGGASLAQGLAKSGKSVSQIVSSLFRNSGDNNVGSGLSHYASGKGSIKDSELAVVGENPKYREIVIGSKLNRDQGVLMNLKRGSGVVNAGATNTLASLLNSLSGAKGNAVERTVNNNNGTTISIGNISLPEVKDGSGFVDYLQNFALDLTQKAYGF